MKIIPPICLFALVACLPGCVAEDATGSTTSKPAKPASQPAAKKAPAAAQAAPTAAGEVGHVDGAGAAKLLAEDPAVTVLDIRRPDEYAAGHLQGAININFLDKDFADQLKKLDTSKRYLLHCRSGGRSTKSLPTFKELGFTKIVHLDGGILSWQQAGQPVVK